MRQMKKSMQSKALVLVLVSLLVAVLVAPQFVQARADRQIESGYLGEGDPLDSNDYTDGGSGGGTDNDVHEYTTAPDEDLGQSFIRSLLQRNGKLFVPFFHGASLYVRVIDVPVKQLAAVQYAK